MVEDSLPVQGWDVFIDSQHRIGTASTIHHAIIHQGVLGASEGGIGTHFQPFLDHVVGIDTSGIFLLLAFLNHTLVVHISHAEVEVALLGGIGETHHVILLEACTIHCIQPVAVEVVLVSFLLIISKDLVTSHHHIIDIFFYVASRVHMLETIHIGFLTKFEEVFRTHCLRCIGIGLHTKPSIVCHLTLAFGCFLGSDDYDTIGTTRTIECGSRSILEHLNRSHIVQVDGTEARITIVHDETIHHIDRVGRAIDGIDTTDTDGGIIGRTSWGCDKHTSHLALERLIDIVDWTFLEGLGIHAHDSTRQITLLHDSTYQHHLIERIDILLEENLHVLTRHLDRLRIISDIRDGNQTAFLYL